MKYFVVSSIQQIKAFELLGAQGLVDDCDENQLKTKITELINNKDIGTLILSKKAYESSIDVVEAHKSRGTFPIVVLQSELEA